jgi:hypothetical protein
MKVTIQLVVDVDDKKHPIPHLVDFIEQRASTIPGVIDANGKVVEVVDLRVLDTPPKAAA